MAKKEFFFHGKKLEELRSMSVEAFTKMLPSRQRRSITRMLAAKETDERLKLYKKIKKKTGKKIRTHHREFIILPEMVGMTFSIHNGKEYKDVMITEKMLGHFLGEFAGTRTFQQHSAPGIGASRSTKFVSVRA
jgi:small subunit ribosomal protein S19